MISIGTEEKKRGACSLLPWREKAKESKLKGMRGCGRLAATIIARLEAMSRVGVSEECVGQ